MNCEIAKEKISSLVDLQLDKSEKNELLEHLKTCEECNTIYEQEKMLKDLIKDNELKELPYGFNDRLHKKLEEEVDRKSKKSNIVKLFIKRKNRKYLAFAATFLLAVVLVNGMDIPTSITNKSIYNTSPKSDMDFGMVVTESMPMEPAIASVTTTLSSPEFEDVNTDSVLYTLSEKSQRGAPVSLNFEESYQTSRVILKNGYINIELVDLENALDLINSHISVYDGYISNFNSGFLNQYEYNDDERKYAEIQLKIESSEFENTMKYLESLGKVNNSSISSNDVTNQYRDTVSSIENLEVTQTRLRELLKESKTVENTLQIERELTRIRGELERFKMTVKNWDRLSEYSTINISIREVEAIDISIKPIDKNIFQKSQDGLMESINDIVNTLEYLFILLVSKAPIIIIWLVALFILKIIVIKIKRKF